MISTLLLIGCGGGDPAGSPRTGSLAPPPKVVAPPKAATPNIPKAKPVQKTQTVTKSQSTQTVVENPTSNDFLMTTEAVTFEVLTGSQIPQNNLFAIAAPVRNSSTVTVEPPADSAPQRIPSQSLRVRLPKGFSIAPNARVNERGFPDRIVCEGDRKEMAFVEGGVFTQGSNRGNSDNQPEHLAFVSPFYMDITEVTLYEFFLFETELKKADQESRRKVSSPSKPSNAAQDDDYPALGIPFKDAEDYANFFNKAIPTEAEWECAARGPDGNAYPWGNGRPLTSSVDATIRPVASQAADLTTSGLFDMAGNAREWTSDWYSSKSYSEAATPDGRPVRNPTGPKKAELLGERVVRGSREKWELWQRSHANIRESGPEIGFRCILRITDDMIVEGELPNAPGSGTPTDSLPVRPRPGVPPTSTSRGF